MVLDLLKGVEDVKLKAKEKLTEQHQIKQTHLKVKRSSWNKNKSSKHT